LDALLFIQSLCETVLGQLDSAGGHLIELRQVRDTLGMSPAQQEMFRNIEYVAWLGDHGARDALLGSIETSRQAAMALGLGGAETLGRTALMLVHLSEGNDEAAYQIARHNRDLNFLQISIRVLPDLVETAARSGRLEEARVALQELRDVAGGSGTHWGLGVLEKSAALCAGGDDAETHYQVAIVHLSRCRARADLARSHLLYGEWLRRRKRRKLARIQLRAALGHFQDMGATGFAGRARRELAATGEPASAPQHAAESSSGETTLTPQEAAVARLAADGATNAEIAATLSLSPHTVDYHLRKVFRKLGISSRRDLRGSFGHRAMNG
jgi:DNA-binding CsgD family transcriptional regulator